MATWVSDLIQTGFFQIRHGFFPNSTGIFQIRQHRFQTRQSIFILRSRLSPHEERPPPPSLRSPEMFPTLSSKIAWKAPHPRISSRSILQAFQRQLAAHLSWVRRGHSRALSLPERTLQYSVGFLLGQIFKSFNARRGGLLSWVRRGYSDALSLPERSKTISDA